MPLPLSRRIVNSLRALRPSRFQIEIAAAPFVDLQSLIPPERRVVVIAPHPDDEVLGCGGMLAAAAEQGNPLMMIAVTDGEACYPPSPGCSRQQLAAMRRAETMEALRRLGILPTAISRLGLPDGEVHKHAQILTQQLRRLLRPDDIVIATWRHDGHVDHNAVGRAAADAADARGAHLLEVPIWAWHWPANEERHIDRVRARRIALTTRWEVRKEYAVSAYGSQLRPPAPLPSNPALPQSLLRPWLRDWETVIV